MTVQSYPLPTGEQVYRLDHPTGLTIYVYPKEGYRTSYAMFATRYGSVDNRFVVDDRMVEVPAGIAHYLEHKLFENEDCDAFARYAKTGASANAFTSFDVTAYLFGCSDRVEESLEILLDFVQKPYFTEKTVQKEQGIIGQEIRMGEDSPDHCVLFNMLRGMYHVHPVRIDIAGTVESISHITPELLYDCYRTFYNLHNMVLTVCGNVTVDMVAAVADRVLIPAAPLSLDDAVYDEPAEVVEDYVEQTMPVAAPLFYLGYKYPMANGAPSDKDLIAADMIVELLASPSSDLYNVLMEQGLINDTFGGEFYDGRGFALFMFGGESRDPEAVRDAIGEEIARLQEQGVDETRFEELRAAVYGRLLRRFNSVETAASVLMDDHFHGRAPFSAGEAAASLTVEDVNRLLQTLRPAYRTLSVIKGA